MSNRSKRVCAAPEDRQPLARPFAALARLMPQVAATAQPTEPAPTAPSAQKTGENGAAASAQAPLCKVGRLSLSRHKQGRGGKTLWRVAGLHALPDAQLQALLRQVRQRLGCGAHLATEQERPQLYVQASDAAPLAQLLRRLGARQVVGDGA